MAELESMTIEQLEVMQTKLHAKAAELQDERHTVAMVLDQKRRTEKAIQIAATLSDDVKKQIIAEAGGIKVGEVGVPSNG